MYIRTNTYNTYRYVNIRTISTNTYNTYIYQRIHTKQVPHGTPAPQGPPCRKRRRGQHARGSRGGLGGQRPCRTPWRTLRRQPGPLHLWLLHWRLVMLPCPAALPGPVAGPPRCDTACQYVILTCQYTILTCQYHIRTCSYSVLMCVRIQYLFARIFLQIRSNTSVST
jgi:hypothetical protein